MLRYAVFVLAACSFINCELLNNIRSDIELIVVDNVTEYLQQNNLVTLQTLEKSVDDSRSAEPRYQIRYAIGRRVSGDRLVATGSAAQSWPTPQDVTLTQQYPQTGTGAIVSYAEVLVEQSTNEGQGHVTSGGVGQRHITIVIEAFRTTLFRHTTQIFGY